MLGDAVADHRMNLLTEIIRLLLTMVPEQRNSTVCEDAVEYGSEKWKAEEVAFGNE